MYDTSFFIDIDMLFPETEKKDILIRALLRDFYDSDLVEYNGITFQSVKESDPSIEFKGNGLNKWLEIPFQYKNFEKMLSVIKNYFSGNVTKIKFKKNDYVIEGEARNVDDLVKLMREFDKMKKSP